MSIIRTHRLSAKQAEQIKELLNECSNLAGQNPFFPFEDGDLFYLLFTDDGKTGSLKELACAAALSFFEDSGAPYAECCAFARPALRKKGYFSCLFDKLSQDIEDVDLYFPVSAPNEGTLAALDSLGAVHDRDEYRMELELKRALSLPPISFLKASAAEICQKSDIRLRVQWEETESGFFLLTFFREDEKAGTCCLSFFGESVCFYGFEIREKLRGCGLGKNALLLTLSLLKNGLPRRGCRRLFLHVSGTNVPALSLYRKTGFQIQESLSYYLY